MPTRNQIDELKHMLTERDVKFVFKNGTKHDRLEYKVDGKAKWITLSRGTIGDDIRAHKNTMSDLARQIGHLPLVNRKVSSAKKITSQISQERIIIKFGIRKNGELSLSLPAKVMNHRIKNSARVTLKMTPENRLVLMFSDVLGRLPSVNNDTTLVYTFSKSTVPFKYRTETIHGMTGPPLRFLWGVSKLVATGPLPESLLPASQRTESVPVVEAIIEEPTPLNQSLDIGFIFSNDLVKDGRDLKELLNDWLQRMKASGSEATIITVDGEVKISMMVKADL